LFAGCIFVAFCALGVTTAAAALQEHLHSLTTCEDTEAGASEASALDGPGGGESSECGSVVESILAAPRLAADAPPLPVPAPVTDLVATMLIPTPAPALPAVPGPLASAVLSVAPTVGPAPAPASVADPCGQPPSAVQVAADQDVLARAAIGGMALSVGMRCAGVSLIYQREVDPAAVAEFGEGVQLAFRRLSADTGRVPGRRFAVFIFSDGDARLRGFRFLEDAQADLNLTRLASAFQRAGNVWVDASQADTRAKRLMTMAHELTHAFTWELTGGHPVPAWLDEGFAAYAQLAIPAQHLQAFVEEQAAEARRRTLDAFVGRGPRPLYALGEIDSVKDWDANYVDAGRKALQYAQAYSLVQWLVERHGVAALWRYLRDLGSEPYRAGSFTVPIGATGPQVQAARDQAIRQRDAAERARTAELFARAFGVTYAGLEGATRAAWAVEVARAPSPLAVTVRLTPTGVRPDTWLAIQVRVDGRAELLRALDVTPGEYTLQVSSTGAVIETSGRLQWQTEDGSALTQDGISIQIGDSAYGSRGIAAGSSERVAFTLAYGHWAPMAASWMLAPAEQSTRPELPPGAMSDRFPDGNAIIVALSR
jgi:hypothetical protein